eukprot:PITA_33926
MPDVDEPMDPIDPPPQYPSSSKRIPSWPRETLKDAERHIAPRGNFDESKKPNRHQGYLTIMSIIIQNEPSSFEEALKQQAHFVAQGFSRKEGAYYDEMFAPISRYTTIHLIIALVASQEWNLHQMDVKNTFLPSSIKEEVYMEQPEGFKVQDWEPHVCKLKKAPYGLKQAPQAWYERIN